MIKLGFLSIIVGVAAFAGCADSTSPTASGVFPSEGFTGRTLRVEISGDATKWKDGATVSFGDGVTVNMVEVASPTDVFADITIDPTAAPGPRDVSVTSGGTFTLKQAFVLTSPVEVQFIGTPAQGSLPQFKIVNHDFDNPFDTTQGTDPATGATIYPNLSVTGPAGVDFNSPLVGGFTVAEFEISGFALIDVDATSGPVSITSGASATVVTSQSAAVTVTPRTATALTSGTAATAMLANPGDSALFALPAGGSPELARFTTTSTDQNAQPIVAMLGPSGHWADFLGASSPVYGVLPQAGQVYAIVFDGGSEAGYNFSITGHADTITVGAEGNDTTNNTSAGAQASGALPFAMTPSTLSSASDVDYIKFTATAGQVVHVTTSTGNPNTDTAVDVLGGTGGTTSYTPDGGPEDGTLCSFFGCSSLGEDFVSKPLPAGTIYLKVAAGANYATTDKDYTLLFWIE